MYKYTSFDMPMIKQWDPVLGIHFLCKQSALYGYKTIRYQYR